MKDRYRIFILAVKYWLQGDGWRFAKEYAEAIVKGFKKQEDGHENI